MNILYLCDKKSYNTKMSRVRFHGMQAIGKVANMHWSGNNWPDYDNNKTVQENINTIYDGKDKPTLVVAYKPLELRKFGDIDCVKCIRYNEMYDVAWTRKEIDESKSDIVICHHNNDMLTYREIYKNKEVRFINLPHCAEKTIYKEYKHEKQLDILLVGAIFTKSILGDHYPLRIRMAREIIPRMRNKYKCGILKHPGGDLLDAATDRNSHEYAKVINSAKICVTCSGAPKSRFGKYIEIPMCGTAIAADMPGEEQEKFNKFLIEINMDMSDEEIIEKLSYYLDNENERFKVVQEGLKYSENYTQEHYAERFIREVKNAI